ncbi:SDR family NAD(P)-dependent oxidoreductase [Azohydromonas caseinilytica]|uniref:SDR family NAD(P)-dependent oxidoreductase n=1 Tax=Azohydromonas caseinilytica TaxID=2728836 RepID=A0A848FFC4_9BURK|nr:SDR family NAD(P)-dependent oxidoreductase [Azohydromonas caseinilytica]NML16601.1 SDR family NAD(P)-dependent oxidoreductase [Azohydromonas caseinilytica]
MTPPLSPSTATSRPFAIVTGASSGIGYELARGCAERGHDLLIAANEPQIHEAAQKLRAYGTDVQAVETDLANAEGVDKLFAAAGGRAVDVLLANAGHGLGKAFLDQDVAAARHVLDTNVTGTLLLLHKVARQMRERRSGRILITGSIAGYMPGAYQAVYNASKAFLDSFAYALREELKDSGVSVTCLMPGVTDTRFFERADLLDTKIGVQKKDDPAMVARQGIEALFAGKPGVVTGLRNKAQVALSRVTPDTTLAHMHTMQAAPGTAQAHRKAKKVTAVAGAVGGIALLGAWWLLRGPAARRGQVMV